MSTVDDQGVAIGGHVKAIYQVVGMGHAVQDDGTFIIQAKTECDRIITVTRHADESFSVRVSKPGQYVETERFYCGDETSDAYRVFTGYYQAWEKCVPDGS